MNSARRAFEAMKRVESLDIDPELRQLWEAECDLLHAFYSSKVSGSKLTWEEFLSLYAGIQPERIVAEAG